MFFTNFNVITIITTTTLMYLIKRIWIINLITGILMCN